MPTLNIFLSKNTEKATAYLNRHAQSVGCVTLPYGESALGLDRFDQAVLFNGETFPPDFSTKYPKASAVFSYRSFSCEYPLIRCGAPWEAQDYFACFCCSPPSQEEFIPPGMSEDWISKVKQGLVGRNPDTVTVELCAGAYRVPIPYKGHYTPCLRSEALRLVQRQGAVLKMNKNSYYSYCTYSENNRPHLLFCSTTEGVSRMIDQFSSLGITRFALSDEEFMDSETEKLLYLFQNKS